jgi:hypothetical protein
MCCRCYDSIANHTDMHGQDYTSPYAHPFFPAAGNVEAFNFYLWHDVNGDPQPHGVMPWCADECGPEVDSALERVAARWLLDHPNAPLLEWPDPSLALFGAANSADRAA